MTREKNKKEAFNDIYYTASLLANIARKTNNTVADVTKAIGEDGICDIFEYADVKHCLPMDQVTTETASQFHIENGPIVLPSKDDPEVVIPSVTQIGKSYARMVVAEEKDIQKYPRTLMDILCSKFSSLMEDYRSSLCQTFTDYKRAVYHEVANI